MADTVWSEIVEYPNDRINWGRTSSLGETGWQYEVGLCDGGFFVIANQAAGLAGSGGGRVWLPNWGIWPRRGYIFEVPFWLLMVPCMGWLAIVWIRRRRKSVLCPCGYDARGLDVCPECGRDVKA